MSSSSLWAKVSFIIPKSPSTSCRAYLRLKTGDQFIFCERHVSLNLQSNSCWNQLGNLDRKHENKKAWDLDTHLIFDLGQDTLTVFLFAEIKDGGA
jgi:hypothetical protein